MDTKKEKMIRPLSEESCMLARQARREIRLTGKTTVVCPKCGTSPIITMTPRGERTTRGPVRIRGWSCFGSGSDVCGIEIFDKRR